MKKVKINMTPISDTLACPGAFVDNELAEAMKKLGLRRKFSRFGLVKRSGDPVSRILFASLLWPLLRVKSLSAFCGKFIGVYLQGGLNVLYDFLKREDINWGGLSAWVAQAVYAAHGWGEAAAMSAFVVDDTLKHRRGKKVEGVSSHFDHNEGRRVMGQQTLQLGLAAPRGFMPLGQQIYIGEKKVQELRQPFADKRQAVAKDYQRAVSQNKNQMLQKMLRRALRLGFKAASLVGDAWFGTKGNIKAVREMGLCGIFQMKRGLLEYYFQGRAYTAPMLYELVRRRMKRKKGQRFRTYALTVELNLAEKPNEPAQWITVKLVFSAPNNPNKNNWVVFLCTDPQRSVEEILQTYSMRWSVEVYFKEIKQNLGFLWEQSWRYTTHYASIHLSALRYLLFYHLTLSQGGLSYGQVRDKATGKIELLSFAALVWELFRALITGALDGFTKRIGQELIEEIKTLIDTTVETFLQQALHLDWPYVKNQLTAESPAKTKAGDEFEPLF